MRISEITQPLQEGIASFLDRNQDIIPFGSWITGARWGGELDPITGKMVPNKQWQAHLNKLASEQQAALSKQKVANFNAWFQNEMKKIGGAAEPPSADFNQLLDAWANQFLKLDQEKLQYNSAELKAIEAALQQVKQDYHKAAANTKIQAIQKGMNNLIMTWLAQSKSMLGRQDRYSKSVDPSYQFGAQLQRTWDTYFPKRQKDGTSTGNLDMDNLLRGMGFRIDSYATSGAATANPTRQKDLATIFARTGYDTSRIQSVLARLGLPLKVIGTGNPEIDDFLRIVGVSLS